ncbi:MAG: hypothetical protein P8179_25140 [Candidatus Thiodiazotropha sp.]
MKGAFVVVQGKAQQLLTTWTATLRDSSLGAIRSVRVGVWVI